VFNNQFCNEVSESFAGAKAAFYRQFFNISNLFTFLYFSNNISFLTCIGQDNAYSEFISNNLDKNHILSGTLESISENTVDGITGPLFYFGLFGIFGAFVYRVINTFDSMIGYKTKMFENLGWFAANCDKIINYIPSRLTALVMILGSIILGIDWRNSYHVMIRDSSKLESPNAGYPMAVLAGALNTTFEKINHYKIGDGKIQLDISHIKSSIRLMKITSVLFCGLVTIPIIITLSYLGWWLHA